MSGIGKDFLSFIHSWFTTSKPAQQPAHTAAEPEEEIFCWPSSEEGVDMECDTELPAERADFQLVCEASEPNTDDVPFERFPRFTSLFKQS